MQAESVEGYLIIGVNRKKGGGYDKRSNGGSKAAFIASAFRQWKVKEN